MHGLGNDFVIVDCRVQPMPLDEAQIRAFGDRHTGVGFDQLISVEPARDGCFGSYDIWNRDGSRAGQCGNGVRCVAAWLHRDGALAVGESVHMASPSGAVTVCLVSATEVRVEMGVPNFEPARIPFQADHVADTYEIEVKGETLTLGAVSIGNPHAVVQVATLDATALARLGPMLSAHPRFPQGVNAGFVHRLDRGHVQLRVHERGAGWTQACGSGACAAAAVLRQRNAVNPSVRVDLPGGSLQIEWAGAGQPLWMTGPAAFVFEGTWLPPAVP